MPGEDARPEPGAARELEDVAAGAELGQGLLEVRRFGKPSRVGVWAAVVTPLAVPPSVVLGSPGSVIAPLCGEQLSLVHALHYRASATRRITYA